MELGLLAVELRRWRWNWRWLLLWMRGMGLRWHDALPVVLGAKQVAPSFAGTCGCVGLDVRLCFSLCWYQSIVLWQERRAACSTWLHATGS